PLEDTHRRLEQRASRLSVTNQWRGSSSFADETWNACACAKWGQTRSGSPARSTVRNSISGSRAKRASIAGSYHWLNRTTNLRLAVTAISFESSFRYQISFVGADVALLGDAAERVHLACDPRVELGQRDGAGRHAERLQSLT